MSYQYSIYNNTLISNDIAFIYNSLTASIIKLPSKQLESFNGLLSQNSIDDNLKKLVDLGLIVDAKIDEKKIVYYRHNKSKFNRNNLTLYLFPSYVCNLSCSYCVIKKNIQQMSTGNTTNFYKNIINFLKETTNNNIQIKILGGEPLLFIDDIIYFLKNQKNNKNEIEVVTNGTISLNDKYIHDLLVNGLSKIQFTIEAIGKEDDIIRNKEVITNVNKFIQVKSHTTSSLKINLRVNIDTQGKNNLSKTIEHLYETLEDSSVINLYPAFINNINENTTDSCCVASIEQIAVLDDFYTYSKKSGFDTNFSLNPFLGNCSYLREDSFVINPELKLFKCINDLENASNSVGTLSDNKIKLNNLNDAGQLRHFNILNNNILSDVQCSDCSWLPICKGACPISKKDERCKEIMNEKFKLYIKHGKMYV